MNNNQSINDVDEGATAIITHHARKDKQEEYTHWLEEIGAACSKATGFLDLQIIRPIAGRTCIYTTIIRFENEEYLQAWVNSNVRRALLEKAAPLLAANVNHYVRSGLDFWFSPQGANTNPPKRWKQFLLTWSALVPLNLTLPFVMMPILRPFGVENNLFIRIPIVSGIAVLLMVYVIMPRYTKLVEKWLFA